MERPIVLAVTIVLLGYSSLSFADENVSLDSPEVLPSSIAHVLMNDYQDVGIHSPYSSNFFDSYSFIQPNKTSAFTLGKHEDAQGEQFFIQGTYVVMSYDALDIALAAKVQTIDETAVKYLYSTNQVPLNFYSSHRNATTNATLGILGSYQINKDWAIIGAVTARTLSRDATSANLLNNEGDYAHMALIGTSYSF